MNANSYLSRLISENENWKETLEKQGICVKEDEHYYIFNYGMESDFSNPVVQEARGIILEKDTLDVACWPFRKFGNYSESYVDKIDWSTAVVQEKIDGSIIKLFYNVHSGEWQFATNSVIDARNAEVSDTGKSFYDIIAMTAEYRILEKAAKDGEISKDMTYIFELVSPQTKVIIEYPFPKLYYLGARSNVTGQEYGKTGLEKMPRPKNYRLRSLDDCLNAAKEMNSYGKGAVTQEGFVVVDANFHRVKIKTPEYLFAHRIVANGVLTKARAVRLLKEDREIISKYFSSPYYQKQFRFYEYWMAETEARIDDFIRIVRQLYEEYSFERKPVAQIIKNHPYAAFGFRGLGNKLTAGEMLDALPESKYLELIPTYQEVNVMELKKLD